jgi:4-amino-4-deoxy-L-arabinose transferase-like glycosyltransferase
MAMRFTSRPVVALFCLILAAAVFLRFYQLDANPPALFKDEAFFANVAHSLSSTGRDLNGASLPLVSYGHNAAILPLQMYPVVVSVMAFGFNVFAVRFVPAACGVLVVLASFLLARFLFDDAVAIVCALLVAVSPFHVVYSRMGIGATQFMLLFISGLYLVLKGLEGRRLFILFGGLSIGLTFWSYYVAHLFVPLFFFAFSALYANTLKSWREKVSYGLFLLILVVLFAGSLAVSDLSKIPGPPNPASSLSRLASNSLDELQAIFTLDGRWQWPLYGDGFGVLYSIELPLLVLGIIFLLSERKTRGSLLLCWLLIALVLGAFTSNVLNGSVRRSLSCAGPVLEIISAYGLVRLLSFFSKRPKAFWLVAGVCFLSLAFSMSQFFIYYFTVQPVSLEEERVFMTPARDVFAYAESVKSGYGRIVITSDFDTTHWPQWASGTFEDYRILYTRRFGNDSAYVFGNASVYPLDGRTLFIVRPYELENVTPLKVFTYSNGDVAYKAVA